MFRLFCVMLMLLFGFSSNELIAADTLSVLVLPFEIQSEEDMPNLEGKISEMISNHLKLEGANILFPDPNDTADIKRQPLSPEVVKQIGIRMNADHIIWGSINWLDQAYTIKANLTETFGSDEPAIFIEKGENIVSLFGTVKKISDKLAVKLFKRVQIAEIVITGNKRIDADAVLRFIKTAPGDIFSEQSISRDLKSIYSMGYFDDIRVESEDGPQGKIITFHIKEKPTVRNVTVKAGRAIEEEEIIENLTITTGSIVNIFKIQNNIKIIEDLYKEENYHNINVTYTIETLENNLADIEFIIEEGERLRIKEIIIEGNSDYSEKELKSQMETSEKGFFSWLTSSGEYVPEVLDQDAAKLNAFYLNNGYIQSRVSDPEVRIEDEWIYVTIKISEGPRFKVGGVDVSGDIIESKKDLVEKLKIGEQEYFNREVIQEDILALTDFYSDEGYAYPDIAPLLEQDVENSNVNITYDIKKGQQIYFEKINIIGNTKTRDKVIRRELAVYEQGLFSGKKLKRSVRNLYRMEYFEDIKVEQSKGTEDDKMVLDIQVAEKSTGAFSFGAGYSSVESVFAMVSLSQRNLFGRGQQLQLKAEVGGTTTRYNISFTEPWLFDIPLSAGFDIYDWTVDYDDYDKESVGGAIRFGYPVYDYTRVYFSYSYDISDITEISSFAAKEIKDLAGENTTSSISASLSYDSRDKQFSPTEGSDHRLSVEYAGLGGNIGFIKYTAETGWYLPLYKDLVLFLHGKAGYIHENSGKLVPDYEKFYLGGMNSLRGFDWQDISSFDDEGNEIGGDKFVQGNVEFIYPIVKDAGFIAVVFYDTGDVYKNSEDIDLGNLRQTAGFGFRWYSPMGPLRIENGYILDPKEGESSSGRWEFSVGTAF